MKTQFTPGPWEVMNTGDIFTPLQATNAEGITAPSNDGWHIADCDMGALSLDELKANARLIAAAPAMHQLLLELRGHFNCGCGHPRCSREAQQREIDELLAQVRGEQP